ncbi:hypothetical protein Tco_0076518, partial [Tanacetum coccineum]
KLVKKVKKLEGFLKRMNLVLSDSEEEESEAQGRKSQDDPQDSSVQGLVTPSSTRVKTSGEEQEEDIINTASAEQVSTAEGINTGSIKLSTGNEQISTVDAKKSTSDQDKGQREGKAPMISEETPKKSKEQVLQEEASLAEAIRIGYFAKRRDWDLIRAKIEANAELSKSMLGSELQGEEFAKKMVDLVNERKKGHGSYLS